MPPKRAPTFQNFLLSGYSNEIPIVLRRSPRNHPEQASWIRWKGRHFAYNGRHSVLVVYKGKLYAAPRVEENYGWDIDELNRRLQG
jgi:hypothetical protein